MAPSGRKTTSTWHQPRQSSRESLVAMRVWLLPKLHPKHPRRHPPRPVRPPQLKPPQPQCRPQRPRPSYREGPGQWQTLPRASSGHPSMCLRPNSNPLPRDSGP